MKRQLFFLVIVLFADISAAGVKNVAVVETELDAQSGASAEITSAEVRVITTELRREAVKNLPRNKYNVMTSETVIAQGGAFAVDCNEENCVIALGSKIGADYIVRGTITKFQALFILSVEIYETEDGNLVASSDPVRSENVGGLLEKAAQVCAEMYRAFVKEQGETQKSTPKLLAEPEHRPESEPMPSPKPQRKPVQWLPVKTSAGGGALFAGGFGGGLKFSNEEQTAMPYCGGGAYLFFDATYAEVSVGFSTGGGKWESADASTADTLPNMPDMLRSYINIGAFAKCPFPAGNITLFPLMGIEYDASNSVKLKYANGYEYRFDGNPYVDGALSALWFKFGGGFDAGLGQKVYARAEVLYGFRTANAFEKKEANNEYAEITAGSGLTLKVGVGIRF
jgi:TolB-like protein